MRRAQFEVRELIQRAIENQVRQADGGVEWIADGVGEPAVTLEAPGEFGRALRMYETQHAELLGLGPERMKLRVGKFLVGAACADCRATQAEFFHAMYELLDSQCRVLQRDRSKGDKAIRIHRAHLGEFFVLDAA